MSFVKRNYIDGETVITAENLNDIQDAIIQIVPDDVKQALLQIASKVAYIDEHGQEYYDALEAAFYPDASLVSISAVYTQSGTVYDTDSLDSLKADLVVTAHFDDSSTSVVTAYTLSGTLTVGTSTIYVVYGGKTDSFTVTVIHQLIPTGYTQVDYLKNTIDSTSVQSYISTGIAFNNPTEASLIVEFAEIEKETAYDQYQYPIGTRETNTGSKNNIGWGVRLATDHTTVTSWSNDNGASITIPAYTKHRITATWKSYQLTIQDGDNTPVSASQTTRGITGYPICLFGLKFAASASGGQPYGLNGKIYYAKAIQDGTTLFEVYPCIRDADGKVGMYDVINDAFYIPYGNYITAGNDE